MENTDLTLEQKKEFYENYKKNRVVLGRKSEIELNPEQIKFLEKEADIQLLIQAFLRQKAIDSVNYNKAYALIKCFAEDSDYKFTFSEVNFALRKLNESLKDKISYEIDYNDDPVCILNIDGEEKNLANKRNQKRVYSFKDKSLNYLISDNYIIGEYQNKKTKKTEKCLYWNSENLIKWLKDCGIKQIAQNWINNNFEPKTWDCKNNAKPWYKYSEIDIGYAAKNSDNFTYGASVKRIISEAKSYIFNNKNKYIFFKDYNKNKNKINDFFLRVESLNDNDLKGKSDMLRTYSNLYREKNKRKLLKSENGSYNLIDICSINVKFFPKSTNKSKNITGNYLEFLVESDDNGFTSKLPSESFIVGTDWVYLDSFVSKNDETLNKSLNINNVFDKHFLNTKYNNIFNKINNKNIINSFIKLKRNNYISSYLNNSNIKYIDITFSKKKDKWFISINVEENKKITKELDSKTSNVELKLSSTRNYNNSPFVTVSKDNEKKIFPIPHIQGKYNKEIKSRISKINAIQTIANNLLKDDAGNLLSTEEQEIKRNSCRYKKLMKSIERHNIKLQNLVRDRRHQISKRVVKYANSKILELKNFHIKQEISYDIAREEKSINKNERSKNMSVGAYEIMRQIKYKNEWRGGEIKDLSEEDKKEDKKENKKIKKSKSAKADKNNSGVESV